MKTFKEIVRGTGYVVVWLLAFIALLAGFWQEHSTGAYFFAAAILIKLMMTDLLEEKDD